VATTRRPPRRTGKPGRPGLIDRESIVASAVELAHDEGAGAVSMSSVAKRLGVGMPALYYHLRNVDDLLGAVGAALLADMPIPSVRLRWDRWLVALASDFRELLLREPILVRVPRLSVHQPFPPLVVDRAMRVLVKAGFDRNTALVVYGEFIRRVVDLVYAELAREEEARQGLFPIRTLREQAATVTPSEAPELHALVREWDGMPDDIPEASEVMWIWNIGFEILGIRAMLTGASPWDEDAVRS
jgi:AcrR family transcriptional regulator